MMGENQEEVQGLNPEEGKEKGTEEHKEPQSEETKPAQTEPQADEHHEDVVAHLHEDKDYSHMSVDELLKESELLLHESNVVSADKAIKKVKESFEHHIADDKEAAKKEYVETNGSDEGFEFHSSAVSKFYENYKSIRDRKRKHFEEMQRTRENNLKAKRKIINQIKELIDSTDQKGVMGKVKDLQKEWKGIGAVPQAEADELYRTYDALLDRFYDQMSIEFELKELDRKKNLTAKEEICERAEKLIEVENINEAVLQLNHLHEEFRSFGPVPKEVQESVWQRFKTASDKIYQLKREYAEAFKSQLEDNMKKKQQLCMNVEPYADFDSDRIKEWNAQTKEVLKLQKAWEEIGPLPREVAKDINRQFWSNFKKFFHNKSLFFEQLDKQRAENLEKKKVLVEKAQAIQDSEDWNATADQLKALQKDWREIGPVPEKYRDSIYEEFKKACDNFFERRRNKRKEEDKAYIENLKKKEEICLELETLAGEHASFDMPTLEEKTEAFFEIGYVPRRDKDAILDKFLKASEMYVELAAEGISEEDFEDLKLKYQASVLKRVPNGSRKFKNQESGIRHKISALENDIALWRNNLAFFANSKTADKMKEEYNQRITEAETEINRLKDQLRIIRDIVDAADE